MKRPIPESGWASLDLRKDLPTVRVTHFDHGIENGIPRRGILEFGIREHTTIPTDVVDAPGSRIFQPIARALGDVQFAIRIIRRAMLTRLIVRSCTVHVSIILGNMEVNRPRTQLIGHLFIGRPELIIAVTFLQ